ncbi:MAG: polyprenyl synthetase family protein, partial [Rikenellaceae bacterium]
EAFDTAIAVEIFHNFTLLHDDIMDNASVRRSRPTVNVKWDVNTAILSGDTMLIYAYKLLSNSPYVAELLPIFNDMSTKVCEGQQYDMDFESLNIVSRSQYINMIDLKTAVLIAGSMKMGAVVAGASEHLQEQVYRFGTELGIAFQLQDDMLDSFGDQKRLGKKVGGDIIEGKKTFLVVRYDEKASAEESKELHDTLKKKFENNEDKITAVKALFEKHNIKEDCQKEIDLYFEDAMTILNTMQIGDNRKEVLRNIAKGLIKRDK